MGIKLQVKLYCDSCGLFKAIRKGVEEVIKIKANKSGELVCVDTTGPCPANTGGTRYWMCALDDVTGISWLHFSKINSETVKFVSNLLGNLKVKGIKF